MMSKAHHLATIIFMTETLCDYQHYIGCMISSDNVEKSIACITHL